MNETNMNTVEALAREIARVSYIKHHYESVGNAGKFGLMMMENALEVACKSIGSGDIQAMTSAYNELVGFHE